MNALNETYRDIRTIRRRLAVHLGCHEAYNVKLPGLYMYHYGDYITVRFYKRQDGQLVKAFEEKCRPEGFPSDHLITQLMLIAS
jgi:hypothetical protein